MADNLPINFAVPQESTLSSYDWVDIGSGTGYVTLYPFDSITSTTIKYGLLPNIIRSQRIELIDIINGGNKSVGATYQLTPFSSPRTVEGIGYVSLSWYKAAGTTDTNNVTATVTFRKNSDVIATDNRNWTPTGGAKRENATIPLVIPKTNFGVNDVLSIEVRVAGIANSAGLFHLAMGQDPLNRDGTYIIPSTSAYDTQIKFECPFKIDL